MSNNRRRFLAALSAFGAGGLVGQAPARAQTAPCRVEHLDGNEDNKEPNYIVEANLAQFTFLAPIEALGEEIVLFDTAWPAGRKSALAAIKGELTRLENGTISIRQIGFAYPVTALSRDSNLYGIVQIAHDQGATIGLQLTSGGSQLGGFALEKGVYDPNATQQGFQGNAALLIYQSLLSDQPFRAELMSGGVAYSAITVDTPAFKSFVQDTLVVEMNRMTERDATAPCAELPNYEELWEDYDCFLTTACCAVVGLPDGCWELQSLRRLRDGWMSRSARGRADIARYYKEAPAVARRLVASAEGRRQLLRLYWRVIVPAALLARIGASRSAHRIYRRMMVDLLADA